MSTQVDTFRKSSDSFSDILTSYHESGILFSVKHLLELLKLVEAAIEGDRRKGTAYAQQLAEKLALDGEEKAAERLRRALASRTGSSVTAARTGQLEERLPVDSESRLSLANEERIAPDDTRLFFPSDVQETVNEFLRYVAASDQLIAEGLGVSPSLLMYGPPGCGKTALGRHIAARLGLPLITARSDTLISSYLGSTAKNLRLLFDHAAARPCVLFLDEFDAIAKLRDDQHELGELKRVVVSLLQNIDAVRGQTVLLAATNHDHLLDPAVWRRFAYRVHIRPPVDSARRDLFKEYLARAVSDKALERFAAASDGLSGSDIRDICEASRRASVLNAETELKEGDVLRRLLLRTVSTEGISVPELIARAKRSLPHVYTHRLLAEAFGMSPGNITQIGRASCRERV